MKKKVATLVLAAPLTASMPEKLITSETSGLRMISASSPRTTAEVRLMDAPSGNVMRAIR